MFLLLYASGCGGGSDLGSVGDLPVTREEFLEVFNGLPSQEQVEVLEPGGRMALMERIVRKKLLLQAWAEDTSVSHGWEELYRISFLSDSAFRRIASSFDVQAYMDSLAGCGYSSFRLRVVLLDDSLQADELKDSWNAGIFDNSIPSVSAPWSDRSGTSYRLMEGPVHRLTDNFSPLIALESGSAQVLPMYGEWCVCILELTEGQWTQDESAPAKGIMDHISALTTDVVLSRGIQKLADNCSLSGTVLVPSGEGDNTAVVLLGEDTLTVSDILSLMRMASPENFFGGVPQELSLFSPPELIISPETTLWYYVKAIGQRYALRDMAIESGIILQENALDFSRAESVVRERLLKDALLDSAGVAQWYGENSSRFMFPERRSVLLGYTDSLMALEAEIPSRISDFTGMETIVDSTGSLVPTPLQVQESFGPILGPAIFASEEGVLSGPVFLGGELAGFFEVVDVEPPGAADLQEVFSLAASAAAEDRFQEGFEDLIDNLRSSYPVEIDTTAVTEIDLWGSV